MPHVHKRMMNAPHGTVTCSPSDTPGASRRIAARAPGRLPSGRARRRQQGPHLGEFG